MPAEKDTLESRILRAAAAATTDLPEFPDDKSDLPSDYEYIPGDEEEEVEVEEIAENDLLSYLDQQENSLYIAQRLFYHEINTTASQSHADEWHLSVLTCKTVEDLYAHGWTYVDGLIGLDTMKHARKEAETMLANGAFKPARELTDKKDDPFRDGTARDDAVTWLHPDRKEELPSHLKQVLEFIDGPLHGDIAKMIRLRGQTEYQLAYYHPNNARYEKHRDAFPTDDPEDTQQRRVTAIVYLNPGWVPGDGGELKIFGRCDQQGICDAADRTIPPLLGRVVLFLSGAVDHAVLPASKERFALTAWMR